MVLVDTSVWIEVLRKDAPLDLDALVSRRHVVTCLPVIQEVLQGIRDDRAFRQARLGLTSLPRVESPMGLDLHVDAANL